MDRMITAGSSEKPPAQPDHQGHVADVAQHDGGEAREDVRGGAQRPAQLAAAACPSGRTRRGGCRPSRRWSRRRPSTPTMRMSVPRIWSRRPPPVGVSGGPQHAPAPVRHQARATTPMSSQAAGAMMRSKRQVGAGRARAASRRGAAASAGAADSDVLIRRRRPERPPAPVRLTISRATRLTATEMTASTRASSARVAT